MRFLWLQSMVVIFRRVHVGQRARLLQFEFTNKCFCSKDPKICANPFLFLFYFEYLIPSFPLDESLVSRDQPIHISLGAASTYDLPDIIL